MAGGLLPAGTDVQEETSAQQRHLQYGTSAAQGFDTMVIVDYNDQHGY